MSSATTVSGPTRALALTWNGTALTIAPAVPLPKNTTQAELDAVSCVNSRDCVALGLATGKTAAFGKSGAVTILETWNGARWTLHVPAAPKGVPSPEFNAISCPTSAYCVLAGFSVSGPNATTATPVIASWTGSALAAMKAPVPAKSSLTMFNSLSCATASACAATGEAITNSATTVIAFTDVWNGRAWTTANVPWLDALSCVSASSCVATGAINATSGSVAGLTGTLRGKTWNLAAGL